MSYTNFESMTVPLDPTNVSQCMAFLGAVSLHKDEFLSDGCCISHAPSIDCAGVNCCDCLFLFDEPSKKSRAKARERWLNSAEVQDCISKIEQAAKTWPRLPGGFVEPNPGYNLDAHIFGFRYPMRVCGGCQVPRSLCDCCITGTLNLEKPEAVKWWNEKRKASWNACKLKYLKKFIAAVDDSASAGQLVDKLRRSTDIEDLALALIEATGYGEHLFTTTLRSETEQTGELKNESNTH